MGATCSRAGAAAAGHFAGVRAHHRPRARGEGGASYREGSAVEDAGLRRGSSTVALLQALREVTGRDVNPLAICDALLTEPHTMVSLHAADADGTYLYVSSAFETLLGWSPVRARGLCALRKCGKSGAARMHREVLRDALCAELVYEVSRCAICVMWASFVQNDLVGRASHVLFHPAETARLREAAAASVQAAKELLDSRSGMRDCGVTVYRLRMSDPAGGHGASARYKRVETRTLVLAAERHARVGPDGGSSSSADSIELASPLMTAVHAYTRKQSRSSVARHAFLLCLSRDVTQQHEAEAASRRDLANRKAAESRRAIIRFVCHELRVPLNDFALGLQELVDEVADARKQTASAPAELGSLLPRLADTLGVLQAANTTMQNIFSNIMYLSHLEHSNFSPHFDRFLLEPFLRECVDEQSAAALSKRARVDMHLHADSAWENVLLQADRTQLHQAVSQLLANSIRYSPQGAKVRLHAFVADLSALQASGHRGSDTTPRGGSSVYDNREWSEGNAAQAALRSTEPSVLSFQSPREYGNDQYVVDSLHALEHAIQDGLDAPEREPPRSAETPVLITTTLPTAQSMGWLPQEAAPLPGSTGDGERDVTAPVRALPSITTLPAISSLLQGTPRGGAYRPAVGSGYALEPVPEAAVEHTPSAATLAASPGNAEQWTFGLDMQRRPGSMATSNSTPISADAVRPKVVSPSTATSSPRSLAPASGMESQGSPRSPAKRYRKVREFVALPMGEPAAPAMDSQTAAGPSPAPFAHQSFMFDIASVAVATIRCVPFVTYKDLRCFTELATSVNNRVGRSSQTASLNRARSDSGAWARRTEALQHSLEAGASRDPNVTPGKTTVISESPTDVDPVDSRAMMTPFALPPVHDGRSVAPNMPVVPEGSFSQGRYNRPTPSDASAEHLQHWPRPQSEGSARDPSTRDPTQSSMVASLSAAVSSPGASWRVVCIAVEDDGPGVDPAKLESLFVPYRQLNPRIVQDGAGGGLGLSIVREVARLHGGRAGAASTLGKGSVFYMLIPLCVVRQTEASGMHSSASTPELKASLSGQFTVSKMPSIAQMRGSTDSRALSGVRRPALASISAWARPAPTGSVDEDPRLSAGIRVDTATAGSPATRLSTADSVYAAAESGPTPTPGASSTTTPAGIPSFDLHRVSRVLIVEDVPSSRLLLSKQLGRHGIAADLACDGIEAIEAVLRLAEAPPLTIERLTLLALSGDMDALVAAARASPLTDAMRRRLRGGVQAILLDAQMPRLDGYNTARVLTALSMDLPMIGVSANALSDDIRRFLETGVTAFVPKPVSLPQLLWTLVRTRGGMETAAPSPRDGLPTTRAAAAPTHV